MKVCTYKKTGEKVLVLIPSKEFNTFSEGVPIVSHSLNKCVNLDGKFIYIDDDELEFVEELEEE